MPNGTPALAHFSAAARNVSNVQFLANSWLVGPSAGYIATTSMPACCFIRSRREHGPLIWEPGVAGAAIQRPAWGGGGAGGGGGFSLPGAGPPPPPRPRAPRPRRGGGAPPPG